MCETKNRRIHEDSTAKEDSRCLTACDKDRILHSSAFRRLQGVTQVVSADHGHVVHNRLTHSLKVSQIATRLAERLLKRYENEIRDAGGLDVEAVGAAALAHDLGHPPFGHVAEEVLDESLRREGLSDGFEGNAQTFRIVTKLAVRHPDVPGLNLSTLTLNALLKYPWPRDSDSVDDKKPKHAWPKKARKWGVYASESFEYDEARKDTLLPKERQSLEAQVMDRADDIAFSVHDTEDFYRAGLIPLERLRAEDAGERKRFLDSAHARLGIEPGAEAADLNEAFEQASTHFVRAPYVGRPIQRAQLRRWSSHSIGRFVENAELVDGEVRLPKAARNEIAMLQQLTWEYVIEAPGLATQQAGFRRVIGELFRIYTSAIEAEQWGVLPLRYRDVLRGGVDCLFPRQMSDDDRRLRSVADIISGLTDDEALGAYHRLTGINPQAGVAF